MIARLVAALVLSGLFASLPAQVQTEPATTTSLSIKAAVWGQVARPGLYCIEGAPDLLELLSQAGGPTPSADLAGIVLMRERDGSRRRLNLNRIAAQGKPLFIASGDVVFVPESFWSRFNRNLPVISTLAVVANLAISVVLIAQR